LTTAVTTESSTVSRARLVCNVTDRTWKSWWLGESPESGNVG